MKQPVVLYDELNTTTPPLASIKHLGAHVLPLTTPSMHAVQPTVGESDKQIIAKQHA